MKKSLYVLSFLILLIVVFFGGVRFNQRGSDQSPAGSGKRQILHYVDPMNPAHISQEPGIAPCGMPMEPVYADENTPGGSSLTTSSVAPGTVTINEKKQQIIGVHAGEATKTAAKTTIRALGRIVPDENLVYPLIAAIDGWLEEIREATTGSLVDENQVLAQIKVYSYDFFTWQQRYLTELGYTRHMGLAVPPPSGVNQSRRRATSGAGYQAGLPIPESEAQRTRRAVTISQMAAGNRPSHMAEQPSEPEAAAMEQPAAQAGEDHSAHAASMPHGNDAEPGVSRGNNPFYASQGRQELLNFGVEESQLTALADHGAYMSHVDLRSPVKGYILSRQVSSRQKIDRGTECFKIADLSRVWVEANMYGNEAKLIQPGMQAKVSLPGQMKHFAATVSEVPPRFDAGSRSLKVRLEMENPDNFFKPDMFVDVELLVSLPESITVPSSAVIDSGKRQTVYVAVGEGVFEPRAVVTGWRTSDRVEIAEGLQPGEKIVVAGNFLIDSESRMKLAATRLMADKAEQPVQPQAPEPQAPAATPAPPAAMPVADTHKSTAEKVKDPVCGMTVDPDQAMADGLTAEAEGKTYFFCSEDCREQFKQEPLRFLHGKAETPAPTGASGHGGHHHD